MATPGLWRGDGDWGGKGIDDMTVLNGRSGWEHPEKIQL